MPTLPEMLDNLNHTFPTPSGSRSDLETHQPMLGIQIMVDELKLETQMRWDARSNNILGVCREHSKEYSLEFQSMDQAGDVHLASEVSITFEFTLVYEHNLSN
jgi:hypothetical protein